MSSPVNNYRSLAARLVCLALCLFLSGIVQAEEFGRFFTTPGQRARLDNIRNAEPEILVEIMEDDLVMEDEPLLERDPIDALTVKGLVHRKNGASTAWVNESNTYEGDIASQYIKISGDNIQQDQVLMNIEGSNSGINLKVGETYDPGSGQMQDIIDQPVPISSPRSQ